MTCPNFIDPILRTHTLDRGRELSNENDERLQDRLCSLSTPAYVFNQASPALVWHIYHTLDTVDVLYQIRDLNGEEIRPANAYVISSQYVLIVWSEPEAGKALLFAGNSAFGDPGQTGIGVPTDGSWDDGAALIESTDSIADAVDKINELITLLYPPPETLSGDMVITGSLRSGKISAGAGQNLNDLTAGQTFSRIIVTQGITLGTPASPTTQFGLADRGVLSLYQDGNLLESVNLATYFDEGERLGNQSWPSGGSGYTYTQLQVVSVGIMGSIPRYQKGDFKILGGSWIPVGEVKDVQVKHVVGLSTYQTNAVDLFYDDGNLPEVSGTPEIVEETLVSSNYLDGVKYYGIGDKFTVRTLLLSSFDRTYSTNALTLSMPGLALASVPVPIDSTQNIPAKASFVRESSLADDNFSTAIAPRWTIVSGSIVQASNRIEMVHATSPAPTPETFTLKNKSRWIRGSGWTISTDLVRTDLLTAGSGYEAGLIFENTSVGGGSFEFLFREDGASGDTKIEVYYTPGGGSRQLHDSDIITYSTDDVINLIVENTTADTYSFTYTINAGAPVNMLDLTFSDWLPTYTAEIIVSLRATNENEIPVLYPDFSLYFDNFASSGGRAKPYDSIPDTADSFELLSYEVILDDDDQYSINARLEVIPKSPRGDGISVRSAVESRLVNTKGIVSTDTEEFFYDNYYKLPISIDDWDTAPAALTGNWDDTIPLLSGYAMSFNGALRYPQIDFSAALAYLPEQDPGRDYSGTVGNVIYDRGFKPVTPRNSGTLLIDGVTLTNLTNVDVLVDLKIPSRTGWLSLNTPYNAGTFTGIDGDGCRTTASGSSFGFTFGSFSTETSGSTTKGCVIVRITLPGASAPVTTHLQMVGWD